MHRSHIVKKKTNVSKLMIFRFRCRLSDWACINTENEYRMRCSVWFYV